MPSRKKQAKIPQIGAERGASQEDESRTWRWGGEVVITPGDSIEIDAGECGRRVRVDSGTADFVIGEKLWRVSVGGQCYIPRGDAARVSTASNEDAVIQELLA
jgi:mannose-6-phosphate isomerase-like protein (cupin superfamily)